MENTITTTGDPVDIPYLDYQLDIFFNQKERFVVVPKGRRLGATHGAAHFCIESCLEGKKILWVDTVQSNLDRYFNRYFRPTLKQIDKKYWDYKSSQKEFTLLNGLIDFRSAEKPENIEGFGYDIIILNEAGIILKGMKGRYLWENAILPMTLDYKADVFFLGTPKGRKAKKDEKDHKYSLYFELICKGKCVPESENPLEAAPKHKDWKTLQYSSYENPLLNPADIKEIEDEVPHVVRRQEIHGDCIDAGDESVFKTEWFQVVYELPDKHLWRRLIISEDTAFKKGSENDDSAAVVILETTVGYFFLDCWAEKLEFPELVEKNDKFVKEKWSDANFILVEDKASGQSLIQTFKRDVDFRVVAVKADTDKYSRAVAVSPMFQTGKCYLMFGSWNKMFIDQMTDFNECLDTPDDIVDAVSQGLNYLSKNKGARSRPQTRKLVHRSKVLQGY